MPACSEKAQAAIRAVSQHNNIEKIATGMRAAQSCTPKIMYETAIIQYLSGDFSRYGTPSRRAVTQSPELSILRAIWACTASTSSIKDGGLNAQPKKTSAATMTTIS